MACVSAAFLRPGANQVHSPCSGGPGGWSIRSYRPWRGADRVHPSVAARMSEATEPAARRAAGAALRGRPGGFPLHAHGLQFHGQTARPTHPSSVHFSSTQNQPRCRAKTGRSACTWPSSWVLQGCCGGGSSTALLGSAMGRRQPSQPSRSHSRAHLRAGEALIWPLLAGVFVRAG
jgi:hypothetical protein